MRKGRALCAALAVGITLRLAAQTPLGANVDALQAGESFRFGIEAYHRLAFNEAILSFERALSFRPGEPVILDWLGRSYYRSGFEDIALRQWQNAAAGYGPAAPESILISSRIETVRNRRNVFFDLVEDVRYVEAGRFPGTVDGIPIFRQPAAVLPNDDGSVWVAAYGSNELVRLDVNGLVRERKRGNPQSGLDRPYDMVRGQDGRLYVSEFRGGRVSVLSQNGDWLGFLGEKGLGEGQFVAPANLACDEDGYIYVVDYGNPQISKFSPDGEFIHSFGRRSSFSAELFSGLISPSGVAARAGRVYVCDSVYRKICVFDENGRYLGDLDAAGLAAPEGLRFIEHSGEDSGGFLLVSDANRVLRIDPNSSIVSELGVSGNTHTRLLSAQSDANGNILVADFDGNEVEILSPIDDIASGLFVEINRVDSGSFPSVTVEISVQDRRRRPVVGLDERNFVLSEEGRKAANQQFLGGAYRTSEFDLAILVERSPAASRQREALAAAISDIAAALNGSSGTIDAIVAAEERPTLQRFTAGNARSMASAATEGAFSSRWRFDASLRLALSPLFARSPKRAVLFLTCGSLGEAAFEQESLSELAAYMSNNGVVFYAIPITYSGEVDAGLRYLCAETGGKVLPLYRSEGIGEEIRALSRRPSGVYFLSYTSALPTQFGAAFLPVEAEVYLLERSGRDICGYFAPLE